MTTAPAAAGRVPRERTAQLVADAVDSVPGVRRSVGPGVEVATQYRGGKVTGVALGPAEITVCLVALDPHVRRLADAVHAAVRGVLDATGDGRRLDVVVADVDLAGPER